MITFDESILITIILQNTGQELSLEQNITTTSKESFHIANNLLYHNGKVCLPHLHEFIKRNLF